MKALTLLASCLVLGGCASRQVVITKLEPVKGAPVLGAHADKVCFFPDAPALPHQVLGRVLATKKTYGTLDELAMPVAREARNAGANAVFLWSAAQKFKGPNPFRATAPTGTGQAVSISVPFDCASLGGKPL
jgi:hypothetical protein